MTYDPEEGFFELRVWLWRPVPTSFSVKDLFATTASCMRNAPDDIFRVDTGLPRVRGQIPLNISGETTVRRGRLTVWWSSPDLKDLPIGCVVATIATGGIGGFGVDDVGPIRLR